jgi:general secretion pathway protein C
MGQYLSWLTNGVLFVLCCYLVADAANDVFAALLTPTAEDVTRGPAPTARARRDWAHREIILKRNLFNASLLAPAAPVEEPIEDLEATRLPLKLLGTAASTPAEFSWAAVEDEEERRTVIVRVSDPIHKATVQRIERRRIVLSENGVLRELALGEDKSVGARPPPRPRSRARPPRRTARTPTRTPPATAAHDRVEKLAEDRFQMERDDVDDMMRDPTNLFSQARILPKYEEGEMVGLQINAIKPGSFFEEVGIQSGDVITKLNGISIESPQESAKILAEFSQADKLVFDVKRSDGTSETLEFDIEE